jgi:versiconal hemiacetal acetate esterase
VEQELGARPVLHGTAEELRAQFGGLGQLLASQYPPPSEAVQTHDHVIGAFRARVYTPKESPDKPLPVGVYAHGVGFVLGSLDSEDAFCRAVVEHVNTIVLSIEYRLAPENNAPAQVDDFLNGFEWVGSAPSEDSNSEHFVDILVGIQQRQLVWREPQ